MTQLDRIYKYTEIFKRKRLVTKQEFLDQFEISEATFKRDLEKLRDFYHHDIIYDSFEKAYQLKNPDQAYELPGLVFSQKELLGLLTIQNMITELEPGLLGPKLQPLQDRLTELLGSEGLDPQALTHRVRAVHAGKRRLALKCFEELAQATLERKRVHIHHFNRQRNETTERDITPAIGALPGQLVCRRLLPFAQKTAQFLGRCHHSVHHPGHTSKRGECEGNQSRHAIGLRDFRRRSLEPCQIEIQPHASTLGSSRRMAPRSKRCGSCGWQLHLRGPLL